MKNVTLDTVYATKPCKDEWNRFVKAFAGKYGWYDAIPVEEIRKEDGSGGWVRYLEDQGLIAHGGPGCADKGDVVRLHGFPYLVASVAEGMWGLIALERTPGNRYGAPVLHEGCESIPFSHKGKIEVVGKFKDLYVPRKDINSWLKEHEGEWR